MHIHLQRAAILAALSFWGTGGVADDCASAAKAALLATAHQPVTTTTTKAGSDGKASVTQTIQTETNKYVRLASGEWYSMDISIKDVIDDTNSTTVTCTRRSSDALNGVPAVLYELRLQSDSADSVGKIWVSSQTLLLKSEGTAEGIHFATVYDYAHIDPPPNAKKFGVR